MERTVPTSLLRSEILPDDDWPSIVTFARTFDGMRYFGDELIRVSERVRALHQSTALNLADTDELRAFLFVAKRAALHAQVVPQDLGVHLDVVDEIRRRVHARDGYQGHDHESIPLRWFAAMHDGLVRRRHMLRKLFARAPKAAVVSACVEGLVPFVAEEAAIDVGGSIGELVADLVVQPGGESSSDPWAFAIELVDESRLRISCDAVKSALTRLARLKRGAVIACAWALHGSETVVAPRTTERPLVETVTDAIAAVGRRPTMVSPLWEAKGEAEFQLVAWSAS